MSEQILESTRKLLSLADEAMRKESYDQALEYVRRVFEGDPGNKYARAYEERILTVMAEKKAQEQAESIVNARMRSFIAAQEQASRERKPPSPQTQQQVHDTRLKLDEVFKEIETGTQQARERLLEVFLERAADPSHAVEHAKERVGDLANQYKQRLERVRNLMIDHEKALLQSVERDHHDRSRKLYRSLVYMMQKLGVRYQHRAPMLQMVAYFAQLGADDVKELQHSALLGIYEDLVRQVYIQEGPSNDSLSLLEKTRQDFGISESEHRDLLGHARDALLVGNYQPTVAVVESDDSLAHRILEAIGVEFPKVVVTVYKNPESFLAVLPNALPDILVTATLFDQSTMQGPDLLREVKGRPSAKEHFTETVLMVPSTDEYFQEAVRTLETGQIIQKPFSNELLMWTLRPLIFKASGTRVDQHYLRK